MSIKQVELFESNNIWNLQKHINEFILEHYITWNIVDIKYQCISSHLPRNSEDDWNIIYTGMVIYIKPDNDIPYTQPNPILECNNGTVPERLIGGPMIVETGKGEGV